MFCSTSSVKRIHILLIPQRTPAWCFQNSFAASRPRVTSGLTLILGCSRQGLVRTRPVQLAHFPSLRGVKPQTSPFPRIVPLTVQTVPQPSPCGMYSATLQSARTGRAREMLARRVPFLNLSFVLVRLLVLVCIELTSRTRYAIAAPPARPRTWMLLP